MKNLFNIIIVIFLFGCSVDKDNIPEFKKIDVTGAVYGYPSNLPDSIFLSIKNNTTDSTIVNQFVKNIYSYEFDLSNKYTLYSSLTEDNFVTGKKVIANWDHNGNRYKNELRIIMYELE